MDTTRGRINNRPDFGPAVYVHTRSKVQEMAIAIIKVQAAVGIRPPCGPEYIPGVQNVVHAGEGEGGGGE